MNTRPTIVKTALWALIGVLGVVTVARFARGLGASTDLSDATPWGFWIAFDVMSGVALAAGGFVLAATVYIFGREKYRPFVRPAILTAFLGYTAVAVGLLYDLGLPWNIWHPILYPQEHSVLFEVAMCVMLYLTVLSLEFMPVVLEHRWFDRPLFRAIHKLLHTAVIPLVIAGIVLSTLHQSSLGSLFLIAPYRLHPLWYSPIIWVLFFVSAVALGLMMVTAESLFSAWLFRHKPETELLSGLGRAASVVLFVYAALRLGDLAVRGHLGLAFDGSWQAFLFLFEILLTAIVPATLLLFRRVRTSTAGLGACAAMTILGVIGYRFDVCIVAFARPQGMSYFPSWMELAVSLGIVAGGMLVFIFFVERLKVYADGPMTGPDAGPRQVVEADYSPAGMRSLMPASLSAPRRYSLAATVGAAAAVAFLPASLWPEGKFQPAPVSVTRSIDGWRSAEPKDGTGREVGLIGPAGAIPPGTSPVTFLLIDGNRDGRLVLFSHHEHMAELGGQDSCDSCHHENMPFDKNTPCSQCHRDMYSRTDIFDHTLHVDKLGGNAGCADCHRDASQTKSRATALACIECHGQMVAAGSLVKAPAGGMTGFAPGYMDAMHGLCVDCHERKVAENPEKYGPGFAECSQCHGDVDGSRFRQMPPYVIGSTERPSK